MTVKPKGTWMHRFLVNLLTVVLAVLVFWVLGFLVEDIESIPGPRYETIEAQFADPGLAARDKALASEMEDLDRAISAKRDAMQILKDGSDNLQNTINQLIELQKLSVQKDVPLAAAERENLSESLARFLRSQEEYQARNAEFSALVDKKRTLEAERVELDKVLREKAEPVGREYRRQREKHDLYLAGLQLLVLLPLLAAGAYLIVRKRESLYFPLFLGYGAAVLLKIGLVLHTYFPSRYFKYIFAAALLVAVAKLLVHFIRSIAFPKAQWVEKQYREGYERFLCPVCEFPIRRGPRKYLYWTRRTVHKVPLPEGTAEEEPYTCPSCGTTLFEKCDVCGDIRYALLTSCQHCGSEKKEEPTVPDAE